MIYRAIGVMSGSSLDGLDIAFISFDVQGNDWKNELLHADCIAYSNEWRDRLSTAIHLGAMDYCRLHTAYGKYIGEQVNAFIDAHNLHHQVQLIGSHGHTTFHEPENRMTAQLGDGAAIAAVTGIQTVSDLRAMDVALGGQGAPIVPIGETLLLKEYQMFLNLGGIANLSAYTSSGYVAFDVCAANRVMNMICETIGQQYDEGGAMAAKGHLRDECLAALNALPYHAMPYPKSLANSFCTDEVYPVIANANLSAPDALRTMCEHIAIQISRSIGKLKTVMPVQDQPYQLLVTGGGAHNNFLIERIRQNTALQQVDIIVPDAGLINYKEAMIMALHAVRRWREEFNVIATVTGAKTNSSGGALWSPPIL